VVKVTPYVGASGVQANGHKRLKVICGSNTSYLEDLAWVGDKTPLTLADVRVSPSNAVKPNMGANELAEALNRVLPFTAKDDNRPVLSCVNFEAKEGKLNLVSADGFRLAVVALDYDDGEGNALITRDDLRGIANALKRAKRVRLGFDASGRLDGKQNLILDTELIRYKWTSLDGNYPDWRKLIPSEFKTSVSFDTVEAIKAVSSLKVLADSKAYPIDLTIGNGKVVMANPDDKGQAEINADTDGETIKIRIDGSYLVQALKACGEMVDLKLTSPSSPMLFTTSGYQLVVMPMVIQEAIEAEKLARAEQKAKAEAEPTEQAEPSGVAEAVTDEVTEDTEPVADKPKRKRKAKEPVAVA